MDVVGLCGFTGQGLHWVDEERFVFPSGTGVAVFDISYGSRGFIWRTDEGVGSIATCTLTKSIAVSHGKTAGKIEILTATGFEIQATFDNPSTGKIVDMSFSMDGSRLIAISDFSDHAVIMFDLVSQKMLFCKRLDAVYNQCSINPVDNDAFVLNGHKGITVGKVREYLSEYLVDFETIHLPSGIHNAHNEQLSQSHLMASVAFCIWAPNRRLFVGTSDGIIYQVDVQKKVLRVLTSTAIVNDTSDEYDGYPKTAIVTGQHLVVGTSEGAINWYSLADVETVQWLEDHVSTHIDTVTVHSEYIPSAQLLRLRRDDDILKPVSTMVCDPTILCALVGSSCGSIFKIGLDVNVPVRSDQDEDIGAQSAVFSAAGASQTFDGPLRRPELYSEPLFDLHDGVPLCSASFSVPIIHAEQKTLCDLLVLGSHRGHVSFWRSAFTDEVVSTPRDTNIGPMPKVPKLVSRGNTADKSAVTVVELLSVGSTSGARMLAVGTATGWLEVWLIEAFADEDAEEESELIPIAMATRLLSRRKMFNSAIASIQNSDYSNLISVMSATEDFIYILDISNSATFQRIDCVKLGDHKPASVIWNESNLWVACKDGKVLVYDAKVQFLNQSPHVWEDVQIVSQLHLALSIPHGDSTACLLTAFNQDSAMILSQLPTRDDEDRLVKGVGSLTEVGTMVKFPAMQAPAICADVSPDRNHFATGCADGSINVYGIKKSAEGEISVGHIQTHTPHGAAVLSVRFTVDCAQLVSCAADSSVFYTSVGSDVTPCEKIQSLLPMDELNRIKTVEDRIAYNFENNRVIVDVIREQEDAALVEKFSVKTASLLGEVASVRDRVSTLIAKNSAADDLEKMELFEFVVDVKGRDAILAENKRKVEEIYEHYSSINATNELIAARIRRTCWDAMEMHARRLFPLLQSEYNMAALSQRGSFAPSQFQYVCSFPTKALSDAQHSVLSRVMRYRSVEIRTQRLYAFDRDGSAGTSTLLGGGSWRSTWEPNTLKLSPITIKWLLNDGERWPSEAVIDELLRREKDRIEEDLKAKENKDGEATAAPTAAIEDEYEDPSDKVVDENSLFNMLLPPTCVRSVIQKRNQIVLLNEFCRIIKVKFNGAFDKLCSEKDDCLASIEARNVRIREIFEELNHSEDLKEYSLHDIEMTGTDIKLSRGDVAINPYESAEIRAQKAKEAEEKRKRDAEKDKANVKGRALQDMMNGVLEVKRDLFAAASTIQKPSWYVDGLTVDKMNESQRKEFDEYEALVAAAEEEQSKYRKLLEMEAKKLRGEIVDVCKLFDDKLLQLAKLRMLTQRELLAQEMYISNLSYSMVKLENLTSSLKQTEKNIEGARAKRNVILERMDKMSNRIDELRSGLTVVQEEERAMDRTFRRDIQSTSSVDFDQETLRVLLNLYRIRHYPRKTPELDEDGQPIPAAAEDNKRSSRHGATAGQSRSRRHSGHQSHQPGASRSTMRSHNVGGVSKGGNSAGAGQQMGMLQEAALALEKPEEPTSQVNARHPFFKEVLKQDKVKQEQESHYPLLSPLYMDRDCPDGFNVDQFVWVKLQELRQSRIEREIEAKRISHEIHLLKVKLDQISNDDSTIVAEIDDLKNKYASITTEISTLNSDLHIVIALRQGQDEVDRDAVATDYSQSELIPAAVTQSYNACINELGNEKIGVLSKTKQFRRKMNLISWEAVHLGLEAFHLEELYTDAQLLKVTRDLQRVIREGSDPEQVKTRLDRIGHRKNYLNSAFDKKLEKITAKNSDLKRILQDRAEENLKLEMQIETLQKDVTVRHDVRHARGIDQAAYEKKMKRLMSRRHLVDQVRMQAEQIDFLKDELDKLRQKTYPSFVRATRTRLAANPDETGEYY